MHTLWSSLQLEYNTRQTVLLLQLHTNAEHSRELTAATRNSTLRIIPPPPTNTGVHATQPPAAQHTTFTH